MELDAILPAFLHRFGDRARLKTGDKEELKRSFIVPGISRLRVVLDIPSP
jgi:hypothetical protein